MQRSDGDGGRGEGTRAVGRPGPRETGKIMGISIQHARRKAIAATVAACAAAIAMVPAIWVRDSKGGPAEPPWLFPPVTVAFGDAETWTLGTNRTGPMAVVYVDRSCVHCKAELELWESMAGSDTGALEVWVVASPRSDMASANWVPPSLRARTVQDRDGNVARVLGVKAVPATFWVDAADTVRMIRVGRSDHGMLAENRAALVGRGENGR